MLVVISDLHFEEIARDRIGEADDPNSINLHTRNLPESAFRQIIARLGRDTLSSKPKEVDFVLAGDIFDLHRTQIWFDDELRPFVSCSQIGDDLGDKVLNILGKIAAEVEVRGSLSAFEDLAASKYAPNPAEPGNLEDFPAPVRLHYFPGNHDRLLNATPAIREKVRELLGLAKNGAAFEHQLQFNDPRVLVRHGHEYDPYNFSVDHSATDPFPVVLGATEYDNATFGDFITVNVASRLPYLFQQEYGPEKLLNDPDLRRLYIRLLEFDDVRPQSALLDFLLNIPGWDPEKAWKYLEPIARKLLDEICDDAFFRDWLYRLEKTRHPILLAAIEAFFDAKLWRVGLKLSEVQSIAKKATGNEDGQGPEKFAAREKLIQDRLARFVIAGHTHTPNVVFIDGDDNFERYYIDTGTWRWRFLPTANRSSFGGLKSLTYVSVYPSAEDQGKSARSGGKEESFDYWSGFTRRWPY
jgi:UDP-2,3-diacylglucosamine pyrophosphatase LpxH